MSRIVKDTLRLVAITLIAGVLLSVVYSITKEPIAEAEAKELQDSYKEVFPSADSFEVIEAKCPPEIFEEGVKLNSALFAKSSDGEILGCVFSLTSRNGFGGDIELSMGVSNIGEITGVKVTKMSETPALGANCQTDWIDQYKGINAPNVEYTKTGKSSPNQIDAISGATITTRAVTDCVNTGLALTREQLSSEQLSSEHIDMEVE